MFPVCFGNRNGLRSIVLTIVAAIQDPNTDITLWESGAINTYLVEQYDTEKVFTYATLKERHLVNQWLHFQMSGQGPYYGQAAWSVLIVSPASLERLSSHIADTKDRFNVLHPEKIPSCQERYNNEIRRVLGVLEGQLSTRQWLVGNKMTFADLAFATWNDRLDDVMLVPPEEKFAGFPNVQAWHERMTSRPAWKRAMAKREECMADQQLRQKNGMPEGVESFQQYLELIAKGDETPGPSMTTK